MLPSTTAYIMLCFDDCRAWTVLVQTCESISGGGGGGGVNPPYPPLNTALGGV